MIDTARATLAGQAAANHASRNLDEHTLDLLAREGLFGLRIPPTLGGKRGTCVDYVHELTELAAIDVTSALSVEVHCLASELIVALGSQQQQERWLPCLAEGAMLSGVAITEAGAGSDVRAVGTRAHRRRAGGWELTGDKKFITNTGFARSGCVLVLAKIADTDRMGVFVVPTSTPGYDRHARHEMIGWRAMDTRPLSFNACQLPDEALLGDNEDAYRAFSKVLAFGRLAFAAVAVGLADASVHVAVAHCAERQQFGGPLSALQAVRHRIADMVTTTAAAAALTTDVARRRDEGDATWFGLAASAKLMASQAAVRCTEDAAYLAGARGFEERALQARLYLDAKMLELGEGTSDVQRDIVAGVTFAHHKTLGG